MPYFVLMATAPLDWHYPRTQLAQDIFEAMRVGTLARGTIYAARRKGKTEFLLRDLAPLARDAGWPVAYANLWGYLDQPHLALKHALDAAATDSTGVGKRFARWLPGLTKIAAGAEIAGLGKVEADMEFAKKPQSPTTQDLSAIQAQLTKLGTVKKPLLLLVDEVQHLATSDNFKPLAYFLRTQLDTLGNKVRVVFTGSSRAGLARTFQNADMPFYQSAANIKFPDLDDGFFRHLAACYKTASARKLTPDDIADLKQFHADFGSCPFFPLHVVQGMILSGTIPAAAAITEFTTEWRAAHADIPLTTAEQWLMSRIEKNLPPYEAAALAKLATDLGREVESTRQLVKRALANLQQMAVITKISRGKYKRAAI
jgi:uncharacterized protein